MIVSLAKHRVVVLLAVAAFFVGVAVSAPLVADRRDRSRSIGADPTWSRRADTL